MAINSEQIFRSTCGFLAESCLIPHAQWPPFERWPLWYLIFKCVAAMIIMLGQGAEDLCAINVGHIVYVVVKLRQETATCSFRNSVIAVSFTQLTFTSTIRPCM